MGRVEPPVPMVNASSNDDGISLYTQMSDDEMNDTPPAYSDSSTAAYEPLLGASQSEDRSSRKDGDPQPFRQFDEMEMLMDPRFDIDPVYAEELVQDWSTIPPAQLIRIRGTHRDDSRGVTNSDKTVVDFDIQISLMEYLMDQCQRNRWSKLKLAENDEKTYRGGVFKSKGPVRRPGQDAEAQLAEYPKLSLTAWMHLFCASHAPFKSFRITRSVSGLNTKYLHDSLQSLISATNYRGHTRITFPISNKVTEVHSTNRINSLRFNQWICFFFYITFLWIFTWPYLFFSTRKWSVVSIDWPYSVTDEYGVTSYAHISEEEWFATWNKCIEKSVLAKKKGTLTMQDLVRFQSPPAPFRSGSAAVDRVVEVVGAGIRGVQEVRRQWGWGGDC